MSKRITYVVGGIGGLLLLLIIGGLQSQNWYQPRITQSDVRRQINKQLPMGSTVTRTAAFLAARGWIDPKDIGLYSNRGVMSSDGFEAKDPGGATLPASIPGAYPGFIVSGGIYMKFGFNAKGRLTRYELHDVYTGP